MRGFLHPVWVNEAPTRAALGFVVASWSVTALLGCGAPAVRGGAGLERTVPAIQVPLPTMAALFAVEPGTPIRAFAVSPSGRHLALGGADAVELWDVIQRQKLHVLEGPARDVVSLAFSPDGRTLVGGGYRAVGVWDVSSGQRLGVMSGHGHYVQSVAFSSDGRWLASGSGGVEPSIALWDVSNFTLARTGTYPTRYADIVSSVVVSPDHQRLVALSADRTIRVWNIEDPATPARTVQVASVGTPRVLSFGADADTVIVGTSAGELLWYELSTGVQVRAVAAHHDAVLVVSANPDGETLLSVGRDRTLRRWAMRSGALVEGRELPFDPWAAQAARDGTHVAAAGAEGVAVFAVDGRRGIPPVIAILTPTGRETVDEPRVRVVGKVVDDLGVAEVTINVNGAPVAPRRGDAGRGVRVERAERQIVLDEPIDLQVGENLVTVTAYDMEGLSQTERITVTHAPGAGEVWAAVIGVSRYRHVEGLRYADNDARAFADYLINDTHIPADHVTVLLNEDATLQRLKDVLGVDLKRKARKQDTVILYYAGHGAPETDGSSRDGDGLEKYMLPYEADPARLYSTALPMTEISRIMDRLAAERVVLIQDTCYSGSSGAGARTIQTTMFRGPISDAFLERMSAGEGRIIMTASDANEISFERDELGHGVFTYYLLEAFANGDSDGDGLITATEAFRYVAHHVPAATGQSQHPVKKGEERKAEIVLGKVKKP